MKCPKCKRVKHPWFKRGGAYKYFQCLTGQPDTGRSFEQTLVFRNKKPCLKIFLLIFVSVPEAPPQNISGYNISKSEILVSWKPVPKDKVNGIVIAYNVTYSKIGGGPHSGCKIFNGSRSYGVIDGLLPFTVYSLNVSASTVRGQGPASPAITVKTEEEGRPTLFACISPHSLSLPALK